MNGTTITREHLLTLWHERERHVPDDMFIVSAEMEDSAQTPWGIYLPTSEYFDPRIAQERKIETYAPGCIACSLGIFQQTERWALDRYRLGGELSWWGPEGLHERCKRGQAPIDEYLQHQLFQYDTEMGRRWKTAVKKHGVTAIAYGESFRSYNGSGAGADRYKIKAMGFLARAREDLGIATPQLNPAD